MARELTDKQRLFVAEYLVDLNATQAAIRAGYSKKTAASQGQRLLRNVEISNALSEAYGARIERTGITADRVLEEYARLGFSDMRQFLSWDASGVLWKDSEDLDEGAAACISEVSETISEGGRTRRFKLHSKTHALDKLAQHVKLFGDEKGGGVNVNVNIDNRTAAKPLNEFTDAELDFYENLLAEPESVPND